MISLSYRQKILVKQLKMKKKVQKGKFISMLLSTLGASLLENLSAGKVVMSPGEQLEQDKIFNFASSFKGTLMQICKSPHIFVFI